MNLDSVQMNEGLGLDLKGKSKGHKNTYSESQLIDFIGPNWPKRCLRVFSSSGISERSILRVDVGEKLTSLEERRPYRCNSSFESQVLAVSAGCEDLLEERGGMAARADRQIGGPLPAVNLPALKVISNSLASMSIISLTFSAP